MPQSKQKTEELLNEIVEESEKTGRQIAFLQSPYGSLGGNYHAVIKEVFEPTEEGIGTLVKLWGCTYLYKGRPFYQFMDLIGLPKAMLSEFPKLVLAYSRVLRVLFVLGLLFFKKGLIYIGNIYFNFVYRLVVKKCPLDSIQYKPFIQELRRVTTKVLSELYPHIKEEDLDKDFTLVGCKLGELILRVSRFIFLFLQTDNAYGFRFQDISECLNKKAFKENPAKEIQRLFEIMQIREGNNEAIVNRWKHFSKYISLLLKLNPDIKKFAMAFVEELDFSKLALDDSDWYYCLARQTYAFRGMKDEDRLKLKREIDEEKGHIMYKIYTNIKGEVVVTNAEDNVGENEALEALEKHS